jgi:hypothetical protein
MLMQSGMANNNFRNKSNAGFYGTIGDLQMPKVMAMKKYFAVEPYSRSATWNLKKP